MVTLHGVFTGPDCTLSWVLTRHLRSAEVEHYQVLHTYSFSVRADCMDNEESMHP